MTAPEPALPHTPADSPPAARPRNEFRFIPPVVAVIITLGLLLAGRADLCRWPDLCGPLTAVDITQGRLDTALPAPRPGLRIEQTFVPRRDGLSEIELILVHYGEAAPAGPGSLLVELRDANGALVAADQLAAAGLTHNQTYTLIFPPQSDSAGQTYALSLSGDESNPVSAWSYSLNVYDDGELRLIGGQAGEQANQPAAADLRFTTRYVLTPGDALAAATAPLRQWLILLAAALLLPLPGALLLLAVRPRGWDGAAWWGAALSLGLAGWPVVWQWLALAGWRWTGPGLWAAVGLGWGAAALVARRVRRPSPGEAAASPGRSPGKLAAWGLLAGLLIITLAARFVAVRDLAFPPWVDSSRHALITAVMVAGGQIPTGYAPLLPVDHFPYHYGFHTLSAGVALMTGRPLPVLLLTLMQLIGGLLPLTVYAAGWMVTRRRAAGLLAAFLVALPFFFPGYYATWGRMTQLAAMAIMPVLLALTWRLGRGWPRVWPLVAVLAAGLFLVHFRVFLFYLPFAGLAAASHLIAHRRWRGMAAAGALGALLVLPRVVELLAVTAPLETFQRSLPGYNDFPTGYFTTGWERAWPVAAALGAGLVIVALARRRRWATFPALLLLWVAALFALLAGDRLGLPESLVVNLNSMVITLFLPLALFLAIVAGRVWGWAGRWAAAPVPGVVAAVVVAVLLVFGWRQQANILNADTILALPEDEATLEWVAANLPAGARIAVNAWQWLGATWAGSDGGAWIVPLTGRETTTPPVDHIYNPTLFARSRAFNEAALAMKDWSDPAAAAWLAEQGVSHVFIGRRGGFFDPAALSRNPALDLLYQHDGTFVFAVR